MQITPGNTSIRQDGDSYMKKTNLSLVLAAALLVVLGVILPACRSQETELTFKTIDRRISPGTGEYYENREPALIVISTPQEAAQLDNFVNPEAIEHLKGMDYDNYFALAVFQGWKFSGGYEVNLTHVSSRNNQITVEVDFQEPLPGFQREDQITSPYHLVQVEKPAILEGRLTFLLRAEGNTVATSEAVLP